MKSALAKVSEASVPRVTSTQIVCGDCAGDGVFPVKTLLTSIGTCSRCAGHNIVLAAKLSGALARHLLNQGDKRDETATTK